MMKRCFICGHKMVKKEGLEYAICSNEKCPCSVELNPPVPTDNKKEIEHDEH